MAKLGDKRRAKQATIRPYIATPAYDGMVHSDYAMAMVETGQLANEQGIHITAAAMRNGAFIDLARNTFVQLFLETDCTHLFFIDSDLKWEARAFVGLLKAGKPVTAGVYRRRQEPESYPVHFIEADEKGSIQPVEGGWVQCDRVPTGFLCIERWVIEEMARDARKLQVAGQPETPELFYTKVTDDGKFVGEDYCFCDDYMERYGEPIYVWPDFDFTHGGYECNWHDYMNRMTDEYYEKEGKNGTDQ